MYSLAADAELFGQLPERQILKEIGFIDPSLVLVQKFPVKVR
jgi:hypothetical protein